MKKNKGISLIVLIITIIVIIILAGAVILNLSDNNPIDSADEARIMSDLETFNSDLSVQIGKKYIDNYLLKIKDMDSDETKDDWHVIDFVPSVVGTKYEDDFLVQNGELKLNLDSNLDENTKKIIEEKIEVSREGIITFDDIKNHPKSFLGKEVQYTGYSENTNDIKWKIYNVTTDNKIQLIADSCINLDYKSAILSDSSKYNTYLPSSYEIGWWTRGNCFNDLSNTTMWTEFAITGCSVKGATTIEEFINSYNMYYDSNVKLSWQSAHGGDGYSVEGEVVSNDDLYSVRTTDNINNFYINGKTWSDSSGKKVFAFGYNDGSNKLHQKEVQSGGCGIRPVVTLDSARLENNKGEFIVK